jgi:UDP-2-acetamido-2-deoxy-ribo-hexuluronate aminotransferase
VFVENRADVQQRLQSVGIPTAVHYPRPLHLQPAYAMHAGSVALPHSERAGELVMSLPMSADLSSVQIDRIVAALTDALRR